MDSSVPCELSCGTTENETETIESGTQTERLSSSMNIQCSLSQESRLMRKYLNVKADLRKANNTIKYMKSQKYLAHEFRKQFGNGNILPGTFDCTVRKISRPRSYLRKDVAAGCIIKSISPKAYRLIRKRRWMELPSESVLRKWLRKFTIRDGIQDVLMNIISTKHEEPQDMECFLAFDEMALKEHWVYDKV